MRESKINSKELHNLCSSPNIISMIKSKSIRLQVHAACMGEEKCI